MVCTWLSTIAACERLVVCSYRMVLTPTAATANDTCAEIAHHTALVFQPRSGTRPSSMPRPVDGPIKRNDRPAHVLGAMSGCRLLYERRNY
jgi:hypothetical protein